jgi:protein-S-isoprenylcysteine O-methyltransferase Ste14
MTGRMPRLELRVPPPLAAAVTAALMGAVALGVPSAAVAVPARLTLALAVAALGGCVAVAGVLAFRRHRTTINPLKPERASSLVVTGIYRHTRNPMYLGILLALAGWGVFLANALAALWLPAFAVYLGKYQIGPEERALAAKFGAEFERYAQSVRRWI